MVWHVFHLVAGDASGECTLPLTVQNHPRWFSVVFQSCRNTMPDWSRESGASFLPEIKENDTSPRPANLLNHPRKAQLRPRTTIWGGN